MARIILFIAALISALILFKWIKKQPANKRWQILMVVIGVILLGMVVTGRLHWLFALAGAMIPAIQRILSLLAYLPMIQRMANSFSGNRPSHGQKSQVQTDYLEMELDHDSGALSGIVKNGLFAGRNLANLSIEELMQLHEEYSRIDEDSKLLLENYLDRTHGTAWRGDQAEETSNNSTASHSNISAQEAYDILGIKPGADKQVIIDAHRRLIQKLHPDRGGSSYLAIKINQAKDTLLDQFND